MFSVPFQYNLYKTRPITQIKTNFYIPLRVYQTLLLVLDRYFFTTRVPWIEKQEELFYLVNLEEKRLIENSDLFDNSLFGCTDYKSSTLPLVKSSNF